MKAKVKFDWLMKFVLRFDMEKLEELRFQKVIREFFMDLSRILMESGF